MFNNKQKRIFWLGMHVVLTKTELPRLRKLGYEVFNPPYNSNIYDQSANQAWDKDQPTTLPSEVFKELSQYNFFYNKISPRIGDILNEYFGTIIVTINPDWLQEILKVYHGKVIYRVYGQIGTISEALWGRHCFRTIQERDNFWFVPHAEETAIEEHDWLKQRMRVVPYTLPLDTFEYRDTWNIDAEHKPEIMVTCPNIDNPFYAASYQYLNKEFPQDYFRLYGVQPRQYSDSRVVGTLSRTELMQAYQTASGYFYHYQESNVCYLPPIEMMTVGGPVIYLPNSLLAKYFKGNSPGLALDVEEAQKKIQWLVDGDCSFIQDILDSQEEVRKKYSPEYVDPIFDQTFKDLLNPESCELASPVILNSLTHSEKTDVKRIYILFHFPGDIVKYNRKGEYLSSEGIPRVIRKFVESILSKTDYQVVITCRSSQAESCFGFFSAKQNPERVKLLILDSENIDPEYKVYFRKAIAKLKGQYATYFHVFRSLVNQRSLWTASILNQSEDEPNFLLISILQLFWAVNFSLRLVFLPFISIFLFFMKAIVWAVTKFKIKGGVPQKYMNLVNKVNEFLASYVRFQYVKQINKDSATHFVVIPHYYLFSESSFIKHRKILYLPDYTPHFFATEKFEGNRDIIHAQIGKSLVKEVAAIFTNSNFSKSYLPDTILKVDPQKVTVLPIPLLMSKSSNLPLDPRSEIWLKDKLDGVPYIFYPTQNRPNKQIAFLLKVFKELLSEVKGLKLVLTCSLLSYMPAQDAYNELEIDNDWVEFFPSISDSELSWLYTHASALCLTSTMEGNFPPQIFEALSLNTPIVASKIPLILEVLGDKSDDLLLCDPLNLEEFKGNLLYAFENPEQVRVKQQGVYSYVLQKLSDEQFAQSVASFLDDVARYC